MMTLTDAHEVALDILDHTEHATYTTRPINDNTAWHEAYNAYKAQVYAKKALHERDRTQANYYLGIAIKHLKEYEGKI